MTAEPLAGARSRAGAALAGARGLIPFAGAFALALLVGALLLALGGTDPLDGYDALVGGALGSRYDVGETVVRALPIALVALGVAPALRAGVFTVGAEGQIALGALLAAAVVLAIPAAPAPLLLLAGAGAGALAGIAWAFLPALLRARWNVNEILSTLLLNYVAAALLAWSVRTWLKTDEQVPAPRSDALPADGMLPNWLDGTRLHWGALLVPLAAVALGWWLRTPRALAHDVLETRPQLARRMGLSPMRAIVTTMVVGGAAAASPAGSSWPGSTARCTPRSREGSASPACWSRCSAGCARSGSCWPRSSSARSAPAPTGSRSTPARRPRWRR